MTDEFWEIGKWYYVRSSQWARVGKLVKIDIVSLIFDEVTEIFLTGAFKNFFDGKKPGEQNAWERWPGRVLVSRGAILDACEHMAWEPQW